jgi:hypothetical protein
MIDVDEVMSTDFRTLEQAVFRNTTEDAQQRNLLDSIYGSLDREEKFVLKVLRSVEVGKVEGSSELQGKHYWKDDNSVRDTAAKLADLGLIDAAEGYPRKIIASSLKKVVDDFMETTERSPFVQAYKDVSDLWFAYIRDQHPDQIKRGDLIIHQLSDILFGLDRNAETSAFERYKLLLQKLHKEKSSDRPHFIVVCGNIICGQDPEDDVVYKKQLRTAISELRDLTDYLQPIGETDDEPDGRQIILVPGLFDLFWKKGTQNHGKCRKTWDEQIDRCELSTCKGEALPFKGTPVGDIVFLPMDSLNVDSIKEHLGAPGLDDILDVRRAIQNACRRGLGDWNASEDRAPEKENEIRSKFIEQTMRYVVDDLQGEDMVEGPTFKWFVQGSDTDQQQPLYSDVGVLSKQDWDMIQRSGSGSTKPRRQLGGARSINIAITHHHPYQHNPSPIAEFFEGVRLRRDLANSNVQLLLHGHSPFQCLRNEVISSYRSENGSNRSEAARSLRMITSGIFSKEASYYVETDSRGFAADWARASCKPDSPSFNCIRLQPRFDIPSDGVNVVLEVYELSGNPEDDPETEFIKVGQLAKFSLPGEEQ